MSTKIILPKGGMVWEVCRKCGAPNEDAWVDVVTQEDLKYETKIPPTGKCHCGGALVLNHNFPGTEYPARLAPCK